MQIWLMKARISCGAKPLCRVSRHSHAARRGFAMVAALLILLAVSILGLSAANITLTGQKATQSDRDRQVALEAAEAALLDAEYEISGAGGSGKGRAALFLPEHAGSFVDGCGTGEGNPALGLCLYSPDKSAAAWLNVNLLDTAPSTTRSVPYGRFTGHSLQTGEGLLPRKLPRYIIEQVKIQSSGGTSEALEPDQLYRITAIGFGMQESTFVVLQSLYFKEE